MSLSLITPRANSRAAMMRLVAFRADSHGASVPEPSKLQIKLDEAKGFLKYDRDWSRDKRYSNPQKPGDTPMRFLARKLHHAYELYPLLVLTGVWFILFSYTVYYSFEKQEIWLDRSKDKQPWDWERIRTNYWKRPTLVFDKEGVSHTRLPIMEQLQDEMVAAAKARGTR